MTMSKCGLLYSNGDYLDDNICNEVNCEGVIKKTSKRIMEWVPFIEENNLEQCLAYIVADQWKIEYATEERKARIW